MFDLTKITKDYSVILVDLDNTLFNYTHAHNEAIKLCSNKFHFTIEEYNKAKINIKKRNLKANHHKKELYFKNICEMKNESFFMVHDMYEYYTEKFHENLLADKSTLEMLKNAKENGKKVIAITNYYVIPQIKKLITSGYDGLIDHLITSEEFEVEKPNIKLLDRALELSGEVDKSKIIMFGDSIVDDMGIYDIKYSPYNCSKLLISISGKSGAGKSTISKVLKNVWDCEIIEADGYHKYERNHPSWNNLTHYNPAANNLVKLGLDIKNIYQDINNITVPVYNHANGKFDSVNKLNKESLDVVVIEGLHTLYREVTGDYVKIKMFIDSHLSDSQKIERDVTERNKTEKSVKESIIKRSEDYEKYIQVQKQFSNFIIDVSENEEVKITIKDDLVIDYNNISYIVKRNNESTYVYCNYEELNDAISELMNELKENRYFKFDYFSDYTELLNLVGNILDAPGKGGNVSVKDGDRIILKSSGEDMKNPNSDCSVINIETDELIHGGSFKSGKFIQTKKSRKPTMEYALHKLIKSKYVVHYHPVYVLPYLCSDYLQFDGTVIEYNNPGKDLSNALNEVQDIQNIIYLRNHGVIIHADSLEEIKSLYNSVKEKFFEGNYKAYTPDDYVDQNSEELWLFRNAMENISKNQDLIMKEISEQNKDFLDKDSNELYRRGRMQ